MTDLRHALEDASRSTHDWMTDPHDLLAQGRGRVRRRRALATGAAGLTLAGIVAVTASLGGGPTRTDGLDPADDPTGRTAQTTETPADAGAYDTAPVPMVEALRRCDAYLDNRNGTDQTWVASSRGGDTVDGQPYVGGELWLKPQGGPDPSDDETATGRCYVPETGDVGDLGTLADGSPAVWTDEAVRDLCGSLAGIDLTDWRLMASAGMPFGLRAEFESTNGYGLDCTYTDGTLSQTQEYDTYVRMDPARHHDENGAQLLKFAEGIERVQVGGVCQQLGESGFCPSGGYLAASRQPAYLLVVTPDGVEHRVEVEEGYYAYALPTDGDVPPYYTPRVRIFAADGTLIHDNVSDGGGTAG